MTARRLTVAGAAAIAGLFLLAPGTESPSPLAGEGRVGLSGSAATAAVSTLAAPDSSVDVAGQPPHGAVSSETATAAAPTVRPATGSAAPATRNVFAATGDVLAATASATGAILAGAGIPVGGHRLSLPALGLGFLLRPLRIRA